MKSYFSILEFLVILITVSSLNQIMKLKKYNIKQIFKGHQKKLNKRYSYYFVKSTAKPCDKMVDVIKLVTIC